MLRIDCDSPPPELCDADAGNTLIFSREFHCFAERERSSVSSTFS
jgi:hypothetical protein